MKILNYEVPNSFKSNSFIASLYDQSIKKGKLSLKQIEALEDTIEIELEFKQHDWIPNEDSIYKEDYIELKNKLQRNRFRKIKNKNICIRAMNSIISGEVRKDLIDHALCRDFDPYARRN